MVEEIVAEFATVDATAEAVRVLRALGYEVLDVYTPYPAPRVEAALGLPRSRLTWLALPFGLLGGAAAYVLQWWCNAYDYPLNVGGRPLHSAPALVPITFEMTVLFTGIAAFVAFFVLSRLPELHARIFTAPGFERASNDRCFVLIDAARNGAAGALWGKLHDLGATSASALEDA